MSSRYDALPYRGKAYPYAHPERMAAVGTLFGLRPPDIRTARVLEVGCGDGINIMSMAYQFPRAEFVGADPAPQAILRGTLQAASLGLDNLRLTEAGIEDLAHNDEPFDYIIAHGVFSWVAPAVQDALLDMLGRLLSSEGIAYVSYNALPGWHIRSVARDLMNTVVDRQAAPAEQVLAARSILERYADELPESALHGHVLQTIRDMLREHSDAFWFHDFLSPENHAYSVTDFVAKAGQRGLQFLGEAELGDSMLERVPAELRHFVESETDRLRREQILDHLSNRSFRRTLLCRQHHELSFDALPSSMANLHLAASGFPEGELDLADDVEARFVRRDGERIIVANALVKSALKILCDVQPASVPHEDVVQEAARNIGISLDSDLRENLEQILLFLHGAQLIDILPAPRSVRLDVSEKPLVCRLARWDALQGEYPVMNALHSASAVTPFEQLLLVLCDGTRTIEQLIEVLTDAVETGDLHINTSTEQELTDKVVHDTLVHQVEAALSRLPSVGLLEIDERR